MANAKKSVEWKSRQLRATAFVTGLDPNLRQEWFASVTGSPPETSLVRQREGLFHEEGPYQNGQLTLELKPNRIDWVLQAIQKPESHPFDGLGEFKDTTGPFIDRLLGWLGSLAPLTRVAFGAVLAASVESKEEGYGILRGYLHAVDVDPVGSNDLVYRINRPRVSRVLPTLSLNRLATWTVLRASSVEFGPVETTTADIAVACSLELDMNTSADWRDPIAAKSSSGLLAELVDLALEVAREGDVK